MCASFVLACLIAWCEGPGQTESTRLQRFQRTEPHMGTTFGIVLYAPDESTANRAFQATFARIAELNSICSDFDPDSELSRLSAQSPTPMPVPVSEDLFRVLHASRTLSERSRGAFDVTIGPVTKLWRRARLQKKPPDAEKLHEAMQAVGYEHLVLDSQSRTVELKRPGMRLDLGGIAKGYAVNEGLRTLRQFGITRAIVNAGGNIAAGDPPVGEKAWRIDIAPLEKGGQPTRQIWLVNFEVATSGDAYQFFEMQGTRYSHIVNPQTGWGITPRSSVTVATPAGTLADGLSTAVTVLGPVEGLKLIEETPQAAALIVILENETPKTYESSRFARLAEPPSR